MASRSYGRGDIWFGDVCWSVCFSKGGNWAGYSVDVDGENIIQDCILGRD